MYLPAHQTKERKKDEKDFFRQKEYDAWQSMEI